MAEDIPVDVQTVQIPLDTGYDAAIQKFHSEGWGILPGTKPYGVFHLVRAKNYKMPSIEDLGIQFQLKVDDDQVFVLKADGRLLNSKGEVVNKPS